MLIIPGHVLISFSHMLSRAASSSQMRMHMHSGSKPAAPPAEDSPPTVAFVAAIGAIGLLSYLGVIPAGF